MEVKIQPVSNSAQMEVFLDVSEIVYQDNHYWVPPLRSSLAQELGPNSLFREYGKLQKFIAVTSTGKPLGRIVAAINQKLIAKENKAIGLCGYFECIHDYQVAKSLLDAACGWLANQGITLVRGPINLSTHNGCLFLVEGFDSPPTLMMPYNPSYYGEFWQDYGWKPVKQAYAYSLSVDQSLPPAFARGYQIACQGGIEFRSLRVKGEGFEADCAQIYQLMSQGFAASWSYTPWTEAEFWAEAKSLREIIDPDILLVATTGEKMVGFCLALPDYNIPLQRVGGKLNWWGILKLLWYRRQINQARVSTIVSLPEYRRYMVSLGLIYWLQQQGTKPGKKYQQAELSWIWADNQASRKIIEASGAKLVKIYQVYELELSC